MELALGRTEWRCVCVCTVIARLREGCISAGLPWHFRTARKKTGPPADPLQDGEAYDFISADIENVCIDAAGLIGLCHRNGFQTLHIHQLIIRKSPFHDAWVLFEKILQKDDMQTLTFWGEAKLFETREIDGSRFKSVPVCMYCCLFQRLLQTFHSRQFNSLIFFF